MVDYDQIFSDSITSLKTEGRYRNFLNISRQVKSPVSAHNNLSDKPITLWCTNDYLGMSQHPKVLKAAIDAILSMGLGSGGTRNIGGTNAPMVMLEQEIADLHQRQAALVFTSGYIANDTTLATLAKILPNCIFFSDENNHASMIEGISRSKAEKHIFRHNDADHLESLIAKVPIDCPKIIVFESAYSMDGTISPMSQICDIAERYNALTYLDEVHTVGLYGDRGAGMANQLGVAERITIIQGTLSKAFGTIGGYISADSTIIDTIRSNAQGFIFTTSLPPVITSSATASIQHLKESNFERNLLQKQVAYTKQLLRQYKINIFENDSHIIPILINDPSKAEQASTQLLREFGIYLQHINYPTVQKGSERLRITPTPFHTNEMILSLVQALKCVFSNLAIAESVA